LPYKVVLIFESVDEISKCDHLSRSSTFVRHCLIIMYKMVLTFESVDEIQKCDH